jgi:acyl-CoA dehydrogenase
MDFEPSDKTKRLMASLTAFMDAHVYPNEALYHQQVAADRWGSTPIIAELQAKARAEGLWNLFLPDSEHGAGLSNLEYAPLCEVMGRVHFSPQIFNCAAPDTGNIETIERYGTDAQKARWLPGMLDGEISSAFAMT